jgi:hypothetical protein
MLRTISRHLPWIPHLTLMMKLFRLEALPTVEDPVEFSIVLASCCHTVKQVLSSLAISLVGFLRTILHVF